jgi:hypothetical protein
VDQVVLVLITFVAATVNGALGYGFSSITVPVALLFYTNRILNPALVRPIDEPKERSEHLVARGAYLDRPCHWRRNRELYSLSRSSSMG